MSEAPDVMTIKELCEYLRSSRPVVTTMIEEGLPFFTLTESEDSHKRFNKTGVDEWLAKRSK